MQCASVFPYMIALSLTSNRHNIFRLFVESNINSEKSNVTFKKDITASPLTIIS